MQSGENHQQATSDYHRVIPDFYNYLEDEANINDIDRINFTKLKTFVTRVTI